MAIRDWNYQYFWRNNHHLCLVECKPPCRVLISFACSSKYEFYDEQMYLIATSVLSGEPLCALLDYLLEYDGWANSRDKNTFRGYVEFAIAKWQEEELPL